MTLVTEAPAAAKRPIDKKALLAKYIAERDKRLRADGNAQYLELKGGQSFEQAKMQKDSQWIQELYGSQGYVFAG